MRRLALLALFACGCPLSHGDYPGRACKQNSDCFVGEGETCNTVTNQCEVMVDAGPMPDRPPSVDHPAIDGEVDAPDIDAPDMDGGGL
jgi:hypothetical protein